MVYIELRPPDVVELAEFVREQAARTSPDSPPDDELRAQMPALQGLTLDEARYALRRALAVSPRLGPESLPALLEEKRLLVNRSGVIEFIADGNRARRRRRSGRPQDLAARAPQAFPDARQPERRDRAQGAAHDGHSRLRKEPVGEGHRVVVPTAALPRRHDRDLLRPPRQTRRRVRRGLQDDGRHGAGGAVVRRNRDGHHVHRIRRRTGPHLRLLPHLDAGERRAACSSPPPPTASICCPPK